MHELFALQTSIMNERRETFDEREVDDQGKK